MSKMFWKSYNRVKLPVLDDNFSQFHLLTVDNCSSIKVEFQILHAIRLNYVIH